MCAGATPAPEASAPGLKRPAPASPTLDGGLTGDLSCSDDVYGSNKPVHPADSETDEEDEDLEEDLYSTPEPEDAVGGNKLVTDLQAENSALKQASQAAQQTAHLAAQECRLGCVSWLLI